MAGDWIKIRHALPRSGNVVRIMSACDADKLRTLGGLVSALLLFDEQTDDGHLSGYTLKVFDEVVGLPGLGDALCSEKVAWMKETDDGLQLLEWGKHNGSSAKRRANDAFRKALTRAKIEEDEKCPQSVRKVSEKKRTKCGPEKRREEKSIINTHTAQAREEIEEGDEGPYQKAGPDAPGSVVIPPCLKRDVDLFAGMSGIPDEIADEWYERHEAEDWRPRPGYLPLTTKSWKLDLKNYWKHKQSKQHEHASRRNGTTTAGKAPKNARNSHLPDSDREEIARVSEMEDVRDALRRYVEWPETEPEIITQRLYESSQLSTAVEWLKNRSEGIFEGIYESLAKQGLTDVESWRRFAANRQRNTKMG